eukprot:386987-Pyramimonas_sp.AAC.1
MGGGRKRGREDWMMSRMRTRTNANPGRINDVARHPPLEFPLHKSLQHFRFTAENAPLEDNRLGILNRAKARSWDFNAANQ